MALKADRKIDSDELRYFLNGTASKGTIVSFLTVGGSGVGMDNTQGTVYLPASQSGARPVGMLMTEFVSIDLTKFPINWHKDQANSGDKAYIMTKGWAVTDQIASAAVPQAGDTAVLYTNGQLSGITPANMVTHNPLVHPRVGRFRTNKDQNGFATVYIDL